MLKLFGWSLVKINRRPPTGYVYEKPNLENIKSMEKDISASCDQKQFTQAVNNLLLNAIEAVDHSPDSLKHGKTIIVRVLRVGKTELELMVEDNGCGLPNDIRDRLVEPYITTREKGTGLGLAIVKKIIEDHGGVLNLNDRAGGGASISLKFPIETAVIGTNK